MPDSARMNRLFICSSAFLLSLSLSFPAEAQSDAPWVGETLSGAPCHGQPSGYGPFDYLQRGSLLPNLKIVEGAHFTPEVENLARGNRGTLIGDLDYTLRAWPNHHRALNAMIRYQDRMDQFELYQLGRQGFPPVECYLYRAINFSPEDGTAQMLLAMALHKKGLDDEAREAYEKAMKLSPEDIQLKYNYALLLVDMGDYGKARLLADDVYARGFPLMGLKRKLDRVGASK